MSHVTLKPRLGRPPVDRPKNIRLSIAIDHATYEALRVRSVQTGMPIAEIVRQGVEREVAKTRRSPLDTLPDS